MVAQLRGQHPASVYGENTKKFTIAWHYGGKFFPKPNNLKYEHGKVEYMDFVDVDDFSKLTVDRVARFMKYLGYKLLVGVLYMREKTSLLNGLVRINNMEDVKIMLNGISSSKLVKVYLVFPSRTFVLSWELPTVKWKTNIVIEEILEPDSIREPDLEKVMQPKSQPLSGDEPPIELESQDAYVPQRQEHEWAGWDEDLIELFVQRSGNEELRPESKEQGDGSGQTEHSDHIGASENDNLVDLDYETNEGNEHESQLPGASNVNIDIGLCDLHDEALQESDMDYGDFGELESLGSKGELPSTKRSREFEFNANVNMYMRPGAAPMPGAAHVVPVTIGRGRGDCRPEAIKGAGPMQKGFHPGYSMPAWGANTAGRGFCSGLEFTLPSHK
ncbi:FIP1[V]-like protein [Forsythia ovata]|uniref:FIP1[V]-like protein n=1 Tax=Forsythia ovata TaxID=205694 RepID=A0ABD1S2D6_9LAMI